MADNLSVNQIAAVEYSGKNPKRDFMDLKECVRCINFTKKFDKEANSQSGDSCLIKFAPIGLVNNS